MPCIARKVSPAVREWCAVQMTVRPGVSTHIANAIAPMRYVLPTWRGRDIPTPPTVAAYFPSAVFARISRPAPRCHSSKPIPIWPQRFSTCGQPEDLIPAGTHSRLATSESFRVPLFVWGCRVFVGLLLGAEVNRLDLLRDVLEPASQRGQVAGRAVLVRDRLRDPVTHGDEQVAVRTLGRGLRHPELLLPLRLRVGRHGGEVGLACGHRAHLRGCGKTAGRDRP